MDPLSDELFLAIIRRQHCMDVQVLANEVIRLRGVIYDAKDVRSRIQGEVTDLYRLFKGEGEGRKTDGRLRTRHRAAGLWPVRTRGSGLRYVGEVSRRNAELEAGALNELLVAAVQFVAIFQFVQRMSDDPQHGG